MNLLEAREILKDNGYYVNTINEGCYATYVHGGCGGWGGPYHYSPSGGSSRKSIKHMKPEELEARRAKIAANKAKLAEFKEKQLPKLAKAFNVSMNSVNAGQSAGRITVYISLGSNNGIKISYSKAGKPEYYHINYEGFNLGGDFSDLKSKTNTIEKIGDLLNSFANLK